MQSNLLLLNNKLYQLMLFTDNIYLIPILCSILINDFYNHFMRKTDNGLSLFTNRCMISCTHGTRVCVNLPLRYA